jgi:TonB family protein
MKIKLILIIIALFGISNTTKAQELKKEEVFKWYQVQEKAEFPGGNIAFDNYIKNNIRIPAKAYRKAKNGTIMVSFVVEKDGSISNVNIASKKLLGYGCEAAALKVIKNMPKWKPAIQRDKPCRMAFQKPIRLSFT